MKMFMFEGTPEEISQVVQKMQPGEQVMAIPVTNAPKQPLPPGAAGDGSKFVTVDFARRVLTRIPLSTGMLAVLKKLYEAHPDWASSAELYEASNYSMKQFSGLMGAFGRRMAGTSAYDDEADFFDYQWDHTASAWQWRLPDSVREALEAEHLF
ncbi:hypothetical protein ASD99_31030 [Mesorhizobium sp. Root695]|uniref:hypothetical protein n=1 Tax=unclassified Mesorhizobium TaxID=325217 RepID=UPI00070A2CF9|nr:hypothetical protein [Mesorhizobium sp. Root695]KRB18265.1 hypothetical protein ASD99_31030 [Mesorhizobium sp. Root695]